MNILPKKDDLYVSINELKLKTCEYYKYLHGKYIKSGLFSDENDIAMYCLFNIEKFGIKDSDSLQLIFSKFNNSIDFSTKTNIEFKYMIYDYNKPESEYWIGLEKLW